MSTTPFVSGLASGDPTPTSVVLWGRVDGVAAPVVWTLTDLVGVVAATGAVHPDERGVLRAEVDGLQPGTRYQYELSFEDDNVARFGRAGRPSADGVDPDRRRAGIEAHARWLPRPAHGNGPTPLDRHIPLGDVCDLVMVDTRLGGREEQVGDGVGPPPAPPRDGSRPAPPRPP